MDNDENFLNCDSFYDQELHDDLDKEKHRYLINKISDLNLPEVVKRKKIRTEPRELHELNIVKPNKDKVKIKHLIDTITGSQDNEIVKSIKKFTRKISTKKILSTQLNKIDKDRLERKFFLKNSIKNVSKWEPIVIQNRLSDQLSFPLKQNERKLESCHEASSKIITKNNLEKEIDELLASSENYLNDESPLTEAEEKILRAMSLEEAKLKHRELRKKRILLSYQEAKLNRQNKIKSKSYHRIKKREKLKKKLKEFEELKKKDPQLALEKLNELNKIRIQERATLKHLNTGKWAKFNKIRAKNDPETCKKLAEQIDLNKQLIQKLFDESSDESNDESNDYNDDFDKNENFINNEVLNKDIDYENDNLIFEKNYNNLIEKINIENLQESVKKKKKKKKANLKEKVQQLDNDKDEEEEDEDNEELNHSGDEDYNKDNFRKLVSEALAEDDALISFQKDKKETILNEKGKDINNFLPGWGSWAGHGIKISKKRRNRFIKKAPEIKRRDKNYSNVIISEKQQLILQKYTPKSMPPGINDINLYKKKISKPVSNIWNPETVFRNIIKPKVRTRKGQIIKPMDQDALMNVRKITERNDFSSKLDEIIKID